MDPKRSLGKNHAMMLHVHLLRQDTKERNGVGFMEKVLVILKETREWELKNIFLFLKALVAKNVWQLVQDSRLWD
jgi:hypothetical protein